VLGPVLVNPLAIDVPPFKENMKSVNRFIRVMPSAVKEFKVLSVKTPYFNMLPVINPQPGNVYLIELKNIAPSMELEGKNVTIMTDLPDRPEIAIPFKVRTLPISPPKRVDMPPYAPGNPTGPESASPTQSKPSESPDVPLVAAPAAPSASKGSASQVPSGAPVTPK